jgi:hypothetical protein
MARIIRWAPLVYYLFAVVRGTIFGNMELTDTLAYCGYTGALFSLAMGGDWTSELWRDGNA